MSDNRDTAEPVLSFSTPHDAVLSHFQRRDNVESIQGSSVTPASYPSSNNASLSKQWLYDPFDGSSIAVLNSPPLKKDTPPQNSSSPYAQADNSNRETLWHHLSRVLELQNEVAKMHLDMEGVGPSDLKSKGAAKGRGKGRRKSDAPTKRDVQSSEADEEAVGIERDEEEETTRIREEEFARLTDQFEGRKESINEVMDKLDQLSKALTEFHALQAPNVDFGKASSRQSSATPGTATPLSQKSVPPRQPGTKGAVQRPHLATIPSGSEPGPSNGQEDIIPKSLSRIEPPILKKRNAVTSLILDSLDHGQQFHVTESPDSLASHVKLPPE